MTDPQKKKKKKICGGVKPAKAWPNTRGKNPQSRQNTVILPKGGGAEAKSGPRISQKKGRKTLPPDHKRKKVQIKRKVVRPKKKKRKEMGTEKPDNLLCVNPD